MAVTDFEYNNSGSPNTIQDPSYRMKENYILNYLASFSINEDTLNVQKIKNDLKKVLGVTPAVDVQWLPQKKLFEGNIKTIDSPVSIDIIWAEEDSNDNAVFFSTKYYV